MRNVCEYINYQILFFNSLLIFIFCISLFILDLRYEWELMKTNYEI